MSEAGRKIPRRDDSDEPAFDTAGFARESRDQIGRARQHYEQHGVWPPDPLLDEVYEVRRQIMAEHGNDWRKVLEHYVELDEIDEGDG